MFFSYKYLRWACICLMMLLNTGCTSFEWIYDLLNELAPACIHFENNPQSSRALLSKSTGGQVQFNFVENDSLPKANFLMESTKICSEWTVHCSLGIEPTMIDIIWWRWRSTNWIPNHSLTSSFREHTSKKFWVSFLQLISHESTLFSHSEQIENM